MWTVVKDTGMISKCMAVFTAASDCEKRRRHSVSKTAFSPRSLRKSRSSMAVKSVLEAFISVGMKW